MNEAVWGGFPMAIALPDQIDAYIKFDVKCEQDLKWTIFAFDSRLLFVTYFMRIACDFRLPFRLSFNFS